MGGGPSNPACVDLASPSPKRQTSIHRISETGRMRLARTYHGKGENQLRSAREDERGDAQGNGTLPTKKHTTTQKLHNTHTYTLILLNLCQLLTQHLQEQHI